MKYLLIGIWLGDNPEVVTHPTDRRDDAGQATFAITRRAERLDVPDEVLLIGQDRGTKVLYRWEKNIDVLQGEFDENMAELRGSGPVRPNAGEGQG